jgi:hypothetical protein
MLLCKPLVKILLTFNEGKMNIENININQEDVLLNVMNNKFNEKSYLD